MVRGVGARPVLKRSERRAAEEVAEIGLKVTDNGSEPLSSTLLCDSSAPPLPSAFQNVPRAQHGVMNLN